MQTLTKIDKMKTTIIKQKYKLFFSRKMWQSKMFKDNGYLFSKQELDDAEKSNENFIGISKGIYCYLS